MTDVEAGAPANREEKLPLKPNGTQETEQAVASPSATLNLTKRYIILGSVVLLVVVLVIIGTLFGTSPVGEDSTNAGNVADGGERSVASMYDVTFVTTSPDPIDPSTPSPTTETSSVPTQTATETPAVETTATSAPAVPQSPSALLKLLILVSEAQLSDPSSPQYKAYQWLESLTEPLDLTSVDKVYQRYALTTMLYSLSNATDLPSYASQDECTWPVVSCNATSGLVTQINMARSSFNGVIPPEIGLVPSLEKLDLAENEIQGSIPEELYQLSDLTYLYLHNNAMTGTLSESIGNLRALVDIYLGYNEFTGTIPQNLKSGSNATRPLRYLALNHNKLVGTIPANLRLRKLFYLDLSFNLLEGTLPERLGDDLVRLRLLYLDHNRFTGSIPSNYATIGSSRLIDFILNDNMFTGAVPSGWNVDNKMLLTMRVQHNNLTKSLNKNICQMDVFAGAEMVELSTDCPICSCKSICQNCY